MDLLTTCYTRLISTSNYSATANFHNSQITTSPSKTFPAWWVFTGHSLVTAHNSGDSSASALKFSLRRFPNRTHSEVNSLSLSYITTDGQSASLSWNKAPIWGLRPDFYYCLTIAGFLYGAPSLTRGRVCLLQCTMYNIQYIFLSQI
jgi:hypothetical protein